MYRNEHLDMAIQMTCLALLAYREGRKLDCSACKVSARWHLKFVREGR